MSETARHIIGYTLGFTFFVLFIPFGLFKLSLFDKSIFNNFIFIHSELIRIIIFLPVFISGIIFAIWSNIFLFKIGRGGPTDGFNVAISPRTKKLVTIGSYRYSRNPMVFGAFSFYFSLGIYLNSILCLILLIIFLLLAIIYLKLTEEKRLLKDFGDEYTAYKNCVSMIFPLKRTKKQ